MSNAFQINGFMMQISVFTGGMAATNGYLVRTEGGIWVVDAPEGMAGWLRGQKVKVDTLLLTHQHYDHVLDAAEIQREHGAPLLAWAPYSQELTLELFMQKMAGLRLDVPAFGVDQLLTGKTHVEVCGLSLKLEHIPGHSQDSIVFIAQESQIVFGGDVLFAGSIGRADLPGGDMELLLQGIRNKLLVLPDDFEVYPGHGPVTTLGEERLDNPFLQE